MNLPSWLVLHSLVKHPLSQWSFRIFLSEGLQTSVDFCCLHQAWLGCSCMWRMARRLPLSQSPNRSATLAAWTAVVFAAITALAVWGVANAYPPTLLLPWSILGNGPFPLSRELRLNCFCIPARWFSVLPDCGAVLMAIRPFASQSWWIRSRIEQLWLEILWIIEILDIVFMSSKFWLKESQALFSGVHAKNGWFMVPSESFFYG